MFSKICSKLARRRAGGIIYDSRTFQTKKKKIEFTDVFSTTDKMLPRFSGLLNLYFFFPLKSIYSVAFNLVVKRKKRLKTPETCRPTSEIPRIPNAVRLVGRRKNQK